MFRNLRDWVKRPLQSRSAPLQSDFRRFVPRIEHLEDRLSPANYYFVNFAVVVPSPAAQLANLVTKAGNGDYIGFQNATPTSTIQIAAALPPITTGVTIDGHLTGYDAATNTEQRNPNQYIPLVYTGRAANYVSGLTITNGSDPAQVDGLIIQDFTQAGINIVEGTGGNLIYDNFIGTDQNGQNSTLKANVVAGIRIENSPGNQIGDGTAADRNVIVNRGTFRIDFIIK